MPEWRVAVFVEGNVDRAVLEGLRDARLLGDALHLPERSSAGKDGVLHDLAAALAASLRAIALIDYDHHATLDAFSLFVRGRVAAELVKLRHEGACESELLDGFLGIRIASRMRACIIPVGAPFALEGYVAGSRAMDDYLISLALDADAYGALREGDRHLVEHAHVMKKLGEVLALLARNEIPVQDSKRLCLLLRGLANFHSAQATFAERLMKGAHRVDPSRLGQRFATLLDALRAAESKLREATG
jgi:hypothetical protein